MGTYCNAFDQYYLQENNLNFIEASALDRSNVVYAFENIIRDKKDKYEGKAKVVAAGWRDVLE